MDFFSTAGTAHSTFLLLGHKNKWSRYTSPVFFHEQEQEQEQEQEEQQERRRSISIRHAAACLLATLCAGAYAYAYAYAKPLFSSPTPSLIKGGRSTRLKLKAIGRGEDYYYLLSTTRGR